MSMTLYEWFESGNARKGFGGRVQHALSVQLGSREYNAKIINEENNPELFGIGEDEFARRFLCKPYCFCEGEGDCDPDDCECVFDEPKIGISIGYDASRVKGGDIPVNAIERVVEAELKAEGLDEAFALIHIFRTSGGNTPFKEPEPAKYNAANVSAVVERFNGVVASGVSADKVTKAVLGELMRQLDKDAAKFVSAVLREIN